MGKTQKTQFSKEFVRKIIRMEKDFKIGEQITFIYLNNDFDIWNITITREEKYAPFQFAIKGEKIGTNETWSRRYIGIKEALLHIVNDFNENVNIKNNYINIDEYLNGTSEETVENSRKSDYMMLKRLRSECDRYLRTGDVYDLYYGAVESQISEMKKIYNSFSEEEKPKWIDLEDIDNCFEKMTQVLANVWEEKI